MNAKRASVFALGILLVATLACGIGSQKPTGTPPVVEMMPDLPGYNVIEGEAVQEYIATLAEGAALLAGNPELVVLIEKVDRMIECYQDAGALNLRIFSNESFPLSSGAIAMVDQNRLTDPETLFECATGRLAPLSSQPTLDPCGHSYTLNKDDNAFHIVYAGTTLASV